MGKALDLLSTLIGLLRGVGLLLSEIFRWSNLRAIGQSRVSQLTVLIPFVGYLLVFNPSFAEFFQSTLPKNPSDAPANIVQLHSLRLSFLYFGLLALGIGVGLFSIFAPEQIKSNLSASTHIAEMESVWSPALVRNTFEEIVLRFLSSHDEESAHPVYGTAQLSFPWKPSGYLHDLIGTLFGKYGIPYFPDDRWNDESEGTMVQGTQYHFASEHGSVLTDKIMQVMVSPRLVDRAFASIMLDHAQETRKELFYLDYVSSNYRQFWIRLLISVLYLLGILLLLVPTFTTSVLVALATLKQA
jgi:hypothetical protein